MEWAEIGRAAVLNIMVLTGWLIAGGLTYLIFHREIRENRQYIKDLLETLKVMDDD